MKNRKEEEIQIATIQNLPDTDLAKVIEELRKMMKINLPDYKPGEDKRNYAIKVVTLVNGSMKNITLEDAQVKAAVIVNYSESTSPGIFLNFISKLKGLQILNIQKRKN